jgi:hypothetical protein
MSFLIPVARSGRQWPVARPNCPSISIWKVWLRSNISCEDIKINNYTVYRKDRSDNSGYEGAAIYVADYLLSQRRLEIEVQSLEYLCVEIKK